MHVCVDLGADPAGIELEDADNFRSFDIIVRGQGGRERLSAALVSVGNLAEGNDAYLRVDCVRALAGVRAVDPDWNASFDAMLTYADAQGWVRDDCIQAHCVFADEAPNEFEPQTK